MAKKLNIRAASSKKEVPTVKEKPAIKLKKDTVESKISKTEKKITREKLVPKVASEKVKTPRTVISNKAKLVILSGNRTFNLKSGKLNVKLATGYGAPKDNIKQSISALNEAKCFSREEVSGMRIESPIRIADPSQASEILPGAVFSGENLLNTGEFVYKKMKARKPISLRTPPSNIVKNTMSNATAKEGEDITGKLGEATRKLISSNNFNSNAQPNKESELKATSTTIEDYLRLNIATSGYYMGISGENNFNMTSSTKSYHYLFTFEQKCIDVIADQISGMNEIFTDANGWDTDWLYISQVEYGRRLHIVVNSEKKLQTYMGQQKGELNWGVVGGKFSVEEKTSSLFKETSVEVRAQGGAPFTESDPKKIAAAIKKYFEVPYSKFPIVPISFVATNLNGKPASLITEAFLDGKNCLDTNKVRIRIKEINVIVDDDGADDHSEQLFGQLNIHLYNEKKKKVLVDGKTLVPKVKNIIIPSAVIAYGKEDAPLRVKYRHPLAEDSSALKNKYVDLSIQNLDYAIKIIPVMKEEDDFTDDVFNNQSGTFHKTIRTMLLEGSNVKTFLFTDGRSEVEITVDITPV